MKDIKYQVIGMNGTTENYAWAVAVKDKYGLPHSVSEIMNLWRDFSENEKAGWVADTKALVEKVFGVTLVEIKP